MVVRTPAQPSPTELSALDAPEVAELYDRCTAYFILQDGMAPTFADADELFTDVPPGKDARDQTVLGWRDDKGLYAISAILSDYPRDGIWYLGFMIVDAERRGSGLGRVIYGVTEAWAAARGATEIRLAVLEANEAGERFWRSLGFAEVRRVGPDGFKIKSHRRIELSRHLNGSFVGGRSHSCRSAVHQVATFSRYDHDRRVHKRIVRFKARKRTDGKPPISNI